MRKLACIILGFCMLTCTACGQVQPDETSAAATTIVTTTQTPTTEQSLATERFTVALGKNATAAQRLQAVMRNQAQCCFVDWYDKDRTPLEYLDEIFLNESPVHLDNVRFAVIRLNGKPVVVFNNRIVLYVNNSNVHSFCVKTTWDSPIPEVKTDGTFWIQYAGITPGVMQLRFVNGDCVYHSVSMIESPDMFILNDKNVSFEELSAFHEQYSQKPDAPWMDFTDENIAKAFGK